MQGNATKQIRNIALFAGMPPSPMPGVGGTDKYTGKQYEYFESPTSQFVWDNSQYASNFFKAHVQGIIPGTFETERGAYIRSIDVVEQTTGAKMPNDYQTIYFQDTRIKGLYTGAKVKYAGNTWLAISPFNIADPLSSAVVRRCNAFWRHYDYYGNIKAEPFVFSDGRASASANEYLDYSVIPNWYQKCVIQLNDDTRELAYNRRMVLGSSVVQLRGLVDFITDFSGETPNQNINPEESHVLFFDVQYEQPNEIDDMEKGIADGKSFSWVILPVCESTMNVGGTQTISVSSLRNNEAPDTVKHPVSYSFVSSDESVVMVDSDGVITANAEGSATITVLLDQNPDITAEINITVQASVLDAVFVFEPALPDKLKQLQSYTGTVKVMRGGEEVVAPISIGVSGAYQAVSVEFNSLDNTFSIEAYEASEQPVLITFEAQTEGLYFTKKIQLEGF